MPESNNNIHGIIPKQLGIIFLRNQWRHVPLFPLRNKSVLYNVHYVVKTWFSLIKAYFTRVISRDVANICVITVLLFIFSSIKVLLVSNPNPPEVQTCPTIPACCP